MGNTILVVDDSAVLRASLRATLGAAGFNVIEAQDGLHGLQILRRLTLEGNRPSMILCDVSMPVMDGIRFIKHVKRTSCKYIPILILTTESQMSRIMEGKEAGASGWLVKPFQAVPLVATVKRFVRECGSSGVVESSR